jgi:hypothetical protein
MIQTKSKATYITYDTPSAQTNPSLSQESPHVLLQAEQSQDIQPAASDSNDDKFKL